jgi:hypothetical protein
VQAGPDPHQGAAAKDRSCSASWSSTRCASGSRCCALEAAVEQHAVDDVGADRPPTGVGRLEDQTSSPAVRSCRAQARPGQPGSHHDDLGHPRSLGVDNPHGRRGGARVPA